MAKRLIDANQMLENIELLARHEDTFRQSVILGVAQTIRNAPTVDAVEVVFCKDCEWRDAEGDCLNPKCGKSWYGCHVPDEHYCSYGERKEG